MWFTLFTLTLLCSDRFNWRFSIFLISAEIQRMKEKKNPHPPLLFLPHLPDRKKTSFFLWTCCLTGDTEKHSPLQDLSLSVSETPAGRKQTLQSSVENSFCKKIYYKKKNKQTNKQLACKDNETKWLLVGVPLGTTVITSVPTVGETGGNGTAVVRGRSQPMNVYS